MNLAKCEFGKAEVKFMGRLVGSGIHRPDPQRLQGLAKMEPSRTKKELRKLLGAFGYYREYIQNYSDIAKPLTDLTHNNVPSVIVSRWSIDCQQSFEHLRAELDTPCPFLVLGSLSLFTQMLVEEQSGRLWVS